VDASPIDESAPAAHRADNLPGPLTAQRTELREQCSGVLLSRYRRAEFVMFAEEGMGCRP